MQRLFRGVLGSMLAVLVILGGCSEQSGLIGVDAPSQAHFTLLEDTNTTEVVDEFVTMMQRTKPLLSPVMVSQVISSKDGGTIVVPNTGLRVTFPARAVHRDTEVVVTALPGTNVAYTFAPHGLIFRETVVLEQALQYTTSFKTTDSYGAGYFVDPSLLSGRLARIAERYQVEVDPRGQRVRFGIRHFSGYLVSID